MAVVTQIEEVSEKKGEGKRERAGEEMAAERGRDELRARRRANRE